MTSENVLFVTRTTVGVLLLWAAFAKLRNARSFADAVSSFELVSPRTARALAPMVIVIEFAAGLLLLSGRLILPTAVATLTLFLAFSSIIARSLARGIDASCNCFGAEDEEPISIMTLVRALTLAVLSATTAFLSIESTASELAAPLSNWSLVVALAVLIRLLPVMPLAWSFLRTESIASPTPTRRVSFRHQPLSVSLRVMKPKPSGEVIQLRIE